jgi:uncharacterized SAM-binding protein YcdF (DUF218 family)
MRLAFSARKRDGRRWVWILGAAAFVAAAIVVTAVLREPVLRSVGWVLVADDRPERADIIVVTVAASGAGLLEAAELVHRGVASQVAVFEEVPSALDRELARRGIPFEPDSARSMTSLRALGVPVVEQIQGGQGGSEAEVEAIARWSRQRQWRSIVVVSATDHSRRLRRLLRRSMRADPTRVMVRPARNFGFDPDRWWQTRDGLRLGIFELQKLLLDVMRHPLA